MTNSSGRQQHYRCSNNSSIATQSSSSSSTLYAYKTDYSIAQTTPQSSSYISLHCNKKKVKMAHKKSRHPRFEPRTPRSQGQRPTCYPTQFICIHRRRLADLYICTSRHIGYFDQNENSSRERTRARPRPPLAESGETNNVRHIEQTPHRKVNPISR